MWNNQSNTTTIIYLCTLYRWSHWKWNKHHKLNIVKRTANNNNNNKTHLIRWNYFLLAWFCILARREKKTDNNHERTDVKINILYVNSFKERKTHIDTHTHKYAQQSWEIEENNIYVYFVRRIRRKKNHQHTQRYSYKQKKRSLFLVLRRRRWRRP